MRVSLKEPQVQCELTNKHGEKFIGNDGESRTRFIDNATCIEETSPASVNGDIQSSLSSDLAHFAALLLSGCRSCVTSIVHFFDFALFKDIPEIICLDLSLVLLTAVQVGWMVFLVPHALDRGFPLDRAVFLSTVGGVGNLIGRIFQGPIVDRKLLTGVQLSIVLSIINASLFLVDPVAAHISLALCGRLLLWSVQRGLDTAGSALYAGDGASGQVRQRLRAPVAVLRSGGASRRVLSRVKRHSSLLYANSLVAKVRKNTILLPYKSFSLMKIRYKW